MTSSRSARSAAPSPGPVRWLTSIDGAQRLVVRLLAVLLALSLPARDLKAAAADVAPPATAPATTRVVGHWIAHLPGIAGPMWIDRNLTQGLAIGVKENGAPAQKGTGIDVQIVDWTGVDRGITALTNVNRHRSQSTALAERITNRARGAPEMRITVTAHSAGTGVAVWALEQLPDDVRIDDLVLIASALSPEYDLSRALRHVRGRAFAFNSELDSIVLGAGTRAMGTVDRKNVSAAGMVGFTMPADAADPAQYDKLVQLPYDGDWLRFGNNGEHIGPMSRAFARSVIAPVVMGKGPPPRATTRPGPGATTTRPTPVPTSQPASR